MQIDLSKQIIFATITGSRGYGMNTATSDTDVVGIAIAPKEFYFGHDLVFEQKQNDDIILELLRPDDINGDEKIESTVYEIRKLFKLCAACNPNMIEIVWAPSENHRLISTLAMRILENRELFISKKCRYTFSGYAYSQLKRIQTHRRWLLNPKGARPERTDYGLPELESAKIKEAEALIKVQCDRWDVNDLQLDRITVMRLNEKVSEMVAFVLDTLGVKLTPEEVLDDDVKRRAAMRKIGFDDNLMDILEREGRYRKDFADWHNYQIWKKSRNADRAALEAQFGYDTKHAAHLVRLMRMAKEILEGKGCIVKRPDAEELLAIRRGVWNYDGLIEYVANADAEIERLYRETEIIPHKVDEVALRNLCVGIVQEFLSL